MISAELLQSYFHADYRGTESILKEVLEPIFGQADINNQSIIITPTDKQKAQHTNIVDARHVATLWPLGSDESIKVFDVTIEDRCHIHIARKGIQHLVREWVDRFEGAFIIFHYANTKGRSWRLSYMEKRAKNTDSTSAKRYTYLCGKDYPCRTIAERFSQISPDNINSTILEQAFSAEALSDEFFVEYKNFYDDFVNYVTNDDKMFARFKQYAKNDDKLAQKSVRDYIKKLMGRLVFIQFLQKKAWLKNDLYYMQTLFKESTEKQKEDYLDNVLEPLFFGIFNTKEQDRAQLFNDNKWDKTLLAKWADFPYLNGGLFECDELDELRLPIPSYFFSNPENKDKERKPTDEYYEDACGIFDFFERYNFTIDESDPLDTEVGVDPEMLGKIFENLLEDNKDKGAFYTPKEIVQYMCKESLIAYLVSESQKKNEASKQSQANFEEAIRAFVNDPEMTVTRIARYSEKQLTDMLESLQSVKICDPAIGSGAFPMGLLNLLVNCREALNKALGIGVPRAELKQDIILNNIYGVDIEKGAIDIARLRFWLSIVVDLESPKALPNFDYKFMQGNSLLEQFGGIDLSNLFNSTSTAGKGSGVEMIVFDDTNIKDALLQEKLHTYFSLKEGEDKHRVRQEINNAVKDLLISKLGTAPTLVDEVKKLDISANDQFFLWHTWFKPVFDQGGFDIVIGNPPYGAKIPPAQMAILKSKYITTKTIAGKQKGSTDSYTLFVELAHKLSKSHSVFTYIVPLSFTSSSSLSGVHRLLMSQCETITVSSYAVRPEPVFKNAVVDTSIFICKKNGEENKYLYTTKLHRKKGSEFSLQRLIDNLSFVNSKPYVLDGRLPKIGLSLELSILQKLKNIPSLNSYKDDAGLPIYYRFAGGRYFKVITNYTTNSSAEREILLKKSYANAIGCALSSNLSFWFYQIYSDNHNWKNYEIENFPIPNMSQPILDKLNTLYALYLDDIERNANIRQSSGNSTYNVDTFKEYKIVKSKHIIDEIDDVLGPIYGLTQEEINYIKNYELEFRMAGDN